MRWRALVVAVAAAAWSCGPTLWPSAAESAAAAPVVRKSVSALSPEEKKDFVEAVVKLKFTSSPYDDDLSWYDQFVSWHVALSMCEDPSDVFADHSLNGHNGAMFLPWHRVYVLLFEHALQAVSGKRIAVPYWDWTNPAETALVFSDDFMGGNGDPSRGYAVTTGPFSVDKFPQRVHDYGAIYQGIGTPYLSRNIAGGPGSTLPTQAHVDAALAMPEYDVAPYDDRSDTTRSFRQALEGLADPRPVNGVVCLPDGTRAPVPIGRGRLHNTVHGYVGGPVVEHPPKGTSAVATMGVASASPNDPVFFLHHAMVDRIWAQWQDEHGIDTYRPLSGYPHTSLNDTITPFDESGVHFTPGTTSNVRRLGYRYDVQPVAPPAGSTSLTMSSEPSGYGCPVAARASVVEPLETPLSEGPRRAMSL